MQAFFTIISVIITIVKSNKLKIERLYNSFGLLIIFSDFRDRN